MTRRDSFGRAVLFAAGAALAWFPWAMIAAPVAGAWQARSLYFAGLAVAYVAFLSSERSGGRRPVAVAGLLAVGALVLTGSGGELALALAAVIAVLRVGVLYGPPTPRSLVTELLLLCGGLVLARSLAVSWLPSTAAAVWAYFLVQTLFFLRGDLRVSAPCERDGAAFDDAYRRATALLER